MASSENLTTAIVSRSASSQRGRHRGIARRALERCFSLVDHVKIGGASLLDGILHVDLARKVSTLKAVGEVAG